MVEYGVPASKASTVVARSQAVRGWGTAGDRMSHIGVYSSWAPGSLALDTSQLRWFHGHLPLKRECM